MNFRKQRRDQIELNLIPLIDVVLMLLIFFVVTTTFKNEAQVQITLPQASNDPADKPPQALEITIDKDGRYYVDKQLLINTQLDTVRRALRKVMADQPANPMLIISADGQAPHQSVVTAMDAARQVGLTQLSIATRNSD
ncbi:MAG: biopolymer transporter ExbD [Gammaproteobacteria bacterium]|nr:biopolymer transporter ExbD [Gammaproteobacteria bacterium]